MIITDRDIGPVLRDLHEGETILCGQILKGLSKDEIAWVVVENHRSGNSNRVTLHAYWHDVFVVSKVVTVDDDGNVTWGGTKA